MMTTSFVYAAVTYVMFINWAKKQKREKNILCMAYLAMQSFQPTKHILAYNKTKSTKLYKWLNGLGVWFLLWVQEVSSSNPGWALLFKIIISKLNIYLAVQFLFKVNLPPCISVVSYCTFWNASTHRCTQGGGGGRGAPQVPPIKIFENFHIKMQ
jgi:hypothetical protein